MVSTLALLGGRPVTKNILEGATLRRRSDLERTYLLEAYDSGVWADAIGDEDSMINRFEEEWARFSGSKHCVLVTNGTHSLQLALEALDVGHGDEVIVPGLTWQATASAVCDVNAVPVLVDVDESTLCLDPARVEEAITPRTRALIPVHLYHRMADMDAMRRIARAHRLALIEDCAHAHGSRWADRGAGTVGDLGCFSFQSSKLVNAGEGGALLVQREGLLRRLRSLRTCGRSMDRARMHSGNFRITCFQAAVLRGQLAAFRRNAPLLDRGGRALDSAVDAAPGVRALRRDRKLTRQCGYAFVFLYNREAYDGLSAKRFRAALSAELGLEFSSTYAPLSRSDVYYPHTKKRHRLGSSYLRAIDPARWHLPVAEALWEHKAVLAGWRLAACPPARAHLLTEAIGKIYEHRGELIGRRARRS